ncbi:thioredoxin family protein [bacterium]|nr:thioredoxin family protein [bacterium]
MILMSQGNVYALGKVGKKKQEKKQTISTQEVRQAAIPRLVDLGAEKCIPCKMMAPILEELKAEYQGKMDVIFIDVWQEPKKSREYGVRMIPTQIFYAPEGKELSRHQGFISKEDILATWKKLGYEFVD